jgi:hypothetical protein
MKTILVLILTLISSVSLANVVVEIECGDIHPDYVSMDLSSDFQNEYFSRNSQAEYQAEGYTYFIAGRNCGKGSWQSNEDYQVLIMRERKALLEFRLDLLGPFSINPGKITLTLPSEEVLHNGVVLIGESEVKLLGVVGRSPIAAKLKTNRGSGRVKIIIKKN